MRVVANGIAASGNGGSRMIILALETATEACSAALYCNGVVAERFMVEPRAHGQRLLGMVDDVLREANVALSEVDAIAFGRGPGAFTGVRLAVSVAQGLAMGANKPLVPISTLKAVAYPCLTPDANVVAVAMDARMGEVYWSCYQRQEGNWITLHEERVCRPDCVPSLSVAIDVALGTGWAVYGDALMAATKTSVRHCVADALPRAGAVVGLAVEQVARGEIVSARQAQPVYLRDQVAERAGK